MASSTSARLGLLLCLLVTCSLVSAARADVKITRRGNRNIAEGKMVSNAPAQLQRRIVSTSALQVSPLHHADLFSNISQHIQQDVLPGIAQQMSNLFAPFPVLPLPFTPGGPFGASKHP
eukprot:jgi/Chrzof1/7804/Cz02g37060.t1